MVTYPSVLCPERFHAPHEPRRWAVPEPGLGFLLHGLGDDGLCVLRGRDGVFFEILSALGWHLEDKEGAGDNSEEWY